MTSSNIGEDKSFVDDLNIERGIVRMRVCLCATICWDSALVLSICSPKHSPPILLKGEKKKRLGQKKKKKKGKVFGQKDLYFFRKKKVYPNLFELKDLDFFGPFSIAKHNLFRPPLFSLKKCLSLLLKGENLFFYLSEKKKKKTLLKGETIFWPTL